MKFLVDVSIGKNVETWLSEQGLDVLTVRALDPAMADSAILTIAVAEQRLVITMDKDFGEMVFQSRRAHAGVLLLRMADARSADKIRVLNEIISQYGDDLAGNFSVYQNGQLRIRRGPHQNE